MNKRTDARGIVAQIFNLLYRRVALGKAFAGSWVLEASNALQITNLRDSRVQLCATTPRASPWLRNPRVPG
ncbi:MAG: hypothetical protein ABI651_04545 [Verrucomicrobiota bacterium]